MATTQKSTSRHSKAEKPSPAPDPLPMVIGVLTSLDEQGTPLVAWDGQAAMPCRTLVQLHAFHVGESVALQFERRDPTRPLVMGVVQVQGRNADTVAMTAPVLPLAVSLDDQHLVLTAQHRITLQCGRASVTLDSKGNIELRGTYILSRSSGPNRIKGGSVSLN